MLSEHGTLSIVLASYQVCKHIIKTAYMFTMVFFFFINFLKSLGFILGWGYVASRKVLNLIQSPALRAWPLTRLWLAVEWSQFLKKDQPSMRFAIIAVSGSFIWNQFILSQPQKKKKKRNTHAHTQTTVLQKSFFFSNLRPGFGLQGGFCYPMWRTEHWLQPRLALQPQPSWMSLLAKVLFMKRNYLNPKEQLVSSLYFCSDCQ